MRLEDRIGTRPVQSSGSYRAWKIGAGDTAAVDLAWYSKSGHDHPEQHRLLPFTEPSLALRRHFSGDDETLDWDFVIFRAQPDGGAYEPQAGEELFALRLAPEHMEVALGLKATDHFAEDCTIPHPIERLLDRAARLADKDEFQAAWAAMHFALARKTDGFEPDRVGRAARIARSTKGAIGPSRIAEAAGVSARHMRRSFVERLGLSPRAILRRQRLTALMIDAEMRGRPHWADLAARYNFSDQAHMIRECRALTGLSPGQWHKIRRNLAVSFNT